MPKLWNETVEAHRKDVHEAILDATADLVADGGLLSVTMSGIAERTGIGRATLYKYFPDVESILLAWHRRAIAVHLDQLRAAAADGVETVLETYALILYETRGHHRDAGPALHRHSHVVHAEQEVLELVRELLQDGVARHEVRDDVPTGELAAYCLHALATAGALPSRAAVRRLVAVTVDGLRPR